MASILNRKVKFLHIPPTLGILLGKIIGAFVGDVVLTKDEVRGLMVNKLCSSQKPNGQTLFSDWIRENKDTVGKRYTSELASHFYWKRVV